MFNSERIPTVQQFERIDPGGACNSNRKRSMIPFGSARQFKAEFQAMAFRRRNISHVQSDRAQASPHLLQA